MMLDANDPGRCEAVFDWDMCTVGDPFADLGTLLSAWIEASEGIARRTGRWACRRTPRGS